MFWLVMSYKDDAPPGLDSCADFSKGVSVKILDLLFHFNRDENQTPLAVRNYQLLTSDL